MTFIIEDGGGSGTKAKVTTNGRVRGYVVTESEDRHYNEDDGQVYSLVISQTPTGADDCFAYIKNNSSDDLVMTGFMTYAASDEFIYIKLGDDVSSAAGGSTATPANRNAGSGNTANVTAETGNDITGLTGGTEVERLHFDGATSSIHHEWFSGFVVPQNQSISFWAENGAIALKCTVAFYFHGTL